MSTIVDQRTRLLKLAGILFASLGLTLSTGCNSGDGVDRCVVTGTVTFEGEPLPNGEIRFRADSGPLSGGPIKDGKFRIDHNGGVPVGSHKVTVTAYRMIGSQGSVEGIEAAAGGDEQYIPKKYNKDSTLRVDITGEENPVTKDFNLEK